MLIRMLGTGFPASLMSLPATLICWPIATVLKTATTSEAHTHFILVFSLSYDG
jgi:hypothetical protein